MWFGTSEPDDSKGALPYDTYIIEEMRCDSNKDFELTGADVDWYVKAEDIVLKNKGNQNAGNPQNNNTQGQPKK